MVYIIIRLKQKIINEGLAQEGMDSAITKHILPLKHTVCGKIILWLLINLMTLMHLPGV